MEALLKQKIIILFSIISIIISFACSQGGNPDEAVIPEHIKTMTLQKFEKILTDNKGKIIIADMWATWCLPCRLEIPTFIEIQKTFNQEEVVLITLCSKQDSNGKNMNENQLKKFMKEKGINYQVYFIGNDFFSNSLFASDNGQYAFPTTIFFNKQGKQVNKHIGYATKRFFIKTINKIKEAKND